MLDRKFFAVSSATPNIVLLLKKAKTQRNVSTQEVSLPNDRSKHAMRTVDPAELGKLGTLLDKVFGAE